MQDFAVKGTAQLFHRPKAVGSIGWIIRLVVGSLATKLLRVNLRRAKVRDGSSLRFNVDPHRVAGHAAHVNLQFGGPVVDDFRDFDFDEIEAHVARR